MKTKQSMIRNTLLVLFVFLLISAFPIFAEIKTYRTIEIPLWKIDVIDHRVEISLSMPRSDYVLIEVYNSANEYIETLYQGEVSRGEHTFIWDGPNHDSVILGGGVYIVKLKSGQTYSSRKMIILK